MTARKISGTRVIRKIEGAFSFSRSDMTRLIRDFHSEMVRGLSGRKSSLKMIPTYVDAATGAETGRFIALDLGGTNFRILELELKGRGRSRVLGVEKFVLERRHITGTAEEFFDFLADCIKAFVKKAEGANFEKRSLGFTFSFPVRQTGIASGRLVRWTKGFRVGGVEGADVVRLLAEALERKGLYNITIASLANDTVGTLVARSYEDAACDVGVIIGTGTNACYRERLLNIPKWRGPATKTGRMIINIEWGNFDRLRKTSYDKALDRSSSNPGHQILEKMVSGMYLGELARLVLKDAAPLGWRLNPLLEKRGNFSAEYVSLAAGDSSRTLSRIGRLLRKSGIRDSGGSERRLVKKVCDAVSSRAARVSAAAIAAVVTKMDPDLAKPHTIAIDGSVYEKHPKFERGIKNALKEIFGPKSPRISIVLTKDGSSKGAAIIAAVADGDGPH
jgi:hexokinase